MTLYQILMFYRKIDETTGCWLWTGRLNKNGYGVISLDREDKSRKRDFLVHRVAYEELYCPLVNLCLHKTICPNKHCYNPEHLYDGTYAENVIDARITGVHANQFGKTNKTHCKNGHEFTPENTKIETSGSRRCIACQKDYNKKNWKKYA